jgi:integrase/recombinase XerD
MAAIDAYFVARQPRKDSPHTLAAYRRDMELVCALLPSITGIPIADLTVDDLTLPVMRAAFAACSEGRAKTTIRRRWSTWNSFFNHLVSEASIEGNPMAGVAKPAAPHRQPKPFEEADAHRLVSALMDGVGAGSDRRAWPERDLAVVVTLLVTGLRSAELLGLDVGDLAGPAGERRLRVRGKGDRDRRVPVEDGLETVLDGYLSTRRERFPHQANRRKLPDDPRAVDHFPTTAPLFVDRQGDRMRRGALQYLVRTAYRAAGIDSARAKGALVHALRHTFATRLVDRGATAVELMELLGHRSLNTSQHYVRASGREVRAAAASNPVYGLLDQTADRRRP